MNEKVLNFHEMLDQRSIEMHRLIADKIRQDPRLIDTAKATLARWKEIAQRDPPEECIVEWEVILSQPLDDVLQFIVSSSEKAKQLRQSNPFPGVLNNKERATFRRQWQETHPDFYPHKVAS